MYHQYIFRNTNITITIITITITITIIAITITITITIAITIIAITIIMGASLLPPGALVVRGGSCGDPGVSWWALVQYVCGILVDPWP